MNKQDIYNKVRDHLLAQGKKSFGPDGSCWYREGSLKCAIGALIPDDLYNPAWEGCPVNAIIDNSPRLVGYLGIEGPKDIEFLSRLQFIHDYAVVSEWKQLLSNFAEEHRLQP